VFFFAMLQNYIRYGYTSSQQAKLSGRRADALVRSRTAKCGFG
jgi:hypothetical protein